jgi:hypothetical protein
LKGILAPEYFQAEWTCVFEICACVFDLVGTVDHVREELQDYIFEKSVFSGAVKVKNRRESVYIIDKVVES